MLKSFKPYLNDTILSNNRIQQTLYNNDIHIEFTQKQQNKWWTKLIKIRICKVIYYIVQTIKMSAVNWFQDYLNNKIAIT